jgi:adenosylmethionine-8-amino-7-oxononanoate aminotransferase
MVAAKSTEDPAWTHAAGDVSLPVSKGLRSSSMPALTPEEISAIDAAHVWHPYSTIGAEALPPVVAVGAKGAWLTLVDGGRRVEVLDAMASWWTAAHY